MNTTTSSSTSMAIQSAPMAARRVLQLLEKIEHGTLTVQFPDRSSKVYGTGAMPHAAISLRNWHVFLASMKSGDIGFAESYIAGDWTTPALSDLLRVMIQNRRVVEDLIYGSWWGRMIYRVKHLLNRNHKANSRKNIHAHYDLGNAFYELWLDGTMNYSSALFEGDFSRSMQAAQNAKVRRALQATDVKAGSRVLEIGCGWGALAEMATLEMGAHVTGVTLSTEQLAFANARMKWNGKAEQADLRLQDYRDIDDGPYDAVCSIEMIEAVGQEYWPTYFQTVSNMLKPGGKACIQSIVIDDALFDRYVKSTDFIQQYIFPGGCLPSPSEFRRQARLAGLEVVDELKFGPDYAETLRRWRHDFLAHEAQVLTLGFDTAFIRTWEFYLAYCEAAFDEANTDVIQFTLKKPD
ncbi:MAG: class I SAM-dependent methyltransferase [Betaproteobacteria bacterium]|jgi:cyclopropane-fatty-acyl-phospholipid synthase|nr:class I SAM-dependent methyltransferase [Betaproteobacteria bacterium]NDB43667.1 class I SAM-dependent methyltransferase [Betaproteobacteria bacterium]NDD01073.1 class I SAM-dependent methyltransferase [Betaproteobacteria bacterium]NDD22532.1 class I SAM-dependent methyltransferase [Betaproteobacteria bacterium]NDE23492.1 class I SAM-dependent methyltransferase [Betaproteobacteria bacterium]